MIIDCSLTWCQAPMSLVEIIDHAFSDAIVTEKFGEVQGFEINKLMDGNWLYSSIDGSGKMLANADYSYVKYYSDGCGDEEFMNILSLPVRCKLIKKGTLTLHGSCIMVKDRAYILSAPSGVGKSTRASRWIDTLDAKMISGDRPMIVVNNSEVFGGPWDGKEQVHHPQRVSLAYICEIRRAPFTRVRKITQTQTIKFLTSQAFIPMWDAETAMEALILIRKLSRKVPMVRLLCDRTNEAAREAFNILESTDKAFRKECKDMKLKDGFVIRCVVDEYMAIPVGDKINDFGGTVILNEVSAFVLENMQNPISKEDLLDLIVAEYNVDKTTAEKDLDDLLHKFQEYGMIEE